MSSLFRQSTQEYDAEAAQPLVDRSTIDDDFSAFRSAANDEDRVNVTYVFAPEWPVPGKEEQIVGVLGRDKDETVDMVQRAFPTLAKYPAARILFEVSDIAPSAAIPPGPQQYPPPRTEWAKVMDEAWPQFRRKPPTRIRVTVRDAPGDEDRRRTRERRRVVAVIAGAILGPVIVLGFLIFMAWSFSDDDPEPS